MHTCLLTPVGMICILAGYKNGGQISRLMQSVERMPVFVKEGSILACGSELQYSTENLLKTLLYMHTRAKMPSFTLWLKDENTNYQGYEQEPLPISLLLIMNKTER